MANGLYAKAREAFLQGDIDWLTDTIRVVMVDAADYTVDLSAHQFLSSVPVEARVGTPQTLSNKTATNGVADADNATFPNVTGDTCEAIVVYKHGTTDADSPLIAYFDTGGDANPLSIIPNGGNITVNWSDGADRIFRL
jgi:hypothetical protein